MVTVMGLAFQSRQRPRDIVFAAAPCPWWIEPYTQDRVALMPTSWSLAWTQHPAQPGALLVGPCSTHASFRLSRVLKVI